MIKAGTSFGIAVEFDVNRIDRPIYALLVSLKQ